MRVVLTPRFFGSKNLRDDQLAELVVFGVTQRHRLIPVGTARNALEAWAAKNLAGLAAAVTNALDWAVATEGTEPAARETRIDDAASLASALPLLRASFGLLLESDGRDRAFILAAAEPAWRRWIEAREREGYLMFLNGGGCASITGRIRAMEREQRKVIFVVADSDGLTPGTRSGPINKLAATCVEYGVAHHILTRRTIENYIPAALLEAWCTTLRQPERRKKLRKQAKAFARLSVKLRAHHPMKKGLAGDRRENPAHVTNAYAGVADQHLQRLENGFGSRVGDAFLQQQAQALVLNHETRSELSTLLQKIVEHAR